MRWLLRPARVVGGFGGPAGRGKLRLGRESWHGWLPRVVVVTAPVVVVFVGRYWLDVCRVVRRSFRTPVGFVVVVGFEVLAFER